jgi:hypothetical protein
VPAVEQVEAAGDEDFFGHSVRRVRGVRKGAEGGRRVRGGRRGLGPLMVRGARAILRKISIILNFQFRVCHLPDCSILT